MMMVKIAVMPGFAKGCLHEKIFSCRHAPVAAYQRKLLTRLRQQRPGWAIIIFDTLVPPGGYPATVLARLTWASTLDPWRNPEQ